MHQKSQSYDVGFLRYGVRQTKFFVIMDRFLPFYPPMDPENKNFEKMKKELEEIIILQMFTINVSHMIYGFSDIECNRQNFFVILDCFLPFYPPTNPKNKNFEKLKKDPGDIIILHKCTKNHDQMLYCSLDMARNRFNYFSFWAIFYPFISLAAQKIKIKKKKTKKTPGDIIILHIYTKNYDQMMYGS